MTKNKFHDLGHWFVSFLSARLSSSQESVHRHWHVLLDCNSLFPCNVIINKKKIKTMFCSLRHRYHLSFFAVLFRPFGSLASKDLFAKLICFRRLINGTFLHLCRLGVIWCVYLYFMQYHQHEHNILVKSSFNYHHDCSCHHRTR